MGHIADPMLKNTISYPASVLFYVKRDVNPVSHSDTFHDGQQGGQPVGQEAEHVQKRATRPILLGARGMSKECTVSFSKAQAQAPSFFQVKFHRYRRPAATLLIAG